MVVDLVVMPCTGSSCGCCDAVDALLELLAVLADDPRVRAVLCMASRGEELFSTRKLAMCVGLAPKNMARYVEELRARGIVEAVYEASRLRLYRINPRLSLIYR